VQPWRRTAAELAAFRITLLYVVVGLFWVFASDMLLPLLYADTGSANLARWHLQKILIFISLSALVLHLGVRHLFVEMQARRMTEARLAEAEAFSLLMLGHVSASGEWMEVPPRLATLLGYKPEQLQHRGIAERLAEDSRMMLMQMLDTMRRGEARSFDLELEFRSAMDTSVWVYCNFSLVEKPGDDANHFVVYFRDVTAHREAEEALRRSERLLRQIMDLVPQFIFAKDKDGRFILANQAVADAYGTTLEDLLQSRDEDFNGSTEEVEHFRRTDVQVIETGKAVHLPEEVITDFRGNTRILQTTKIPFVVPETKLAAVLGVSTDITERARAESALRESEQRFRSLIEQAIDPLFIYEMSGRFVEVNRQACASLGYERHELLNLGWSDIALDAQPVLEALEELAQDTPTTIETVHRRRDGSIFPVEMRVGLIVSNGNRLALALARDVTVEKRAEAEQAILSRLAVDLAAAETLEKAAQHIREATEALWQWDSIFVSVRRSGRGRFRMILEIDTVSGVKRSFSPSNYDGSEHRGLEALHEGRPLLINRSPADTATRLNTFGASDQRSRSLMYAPIMVGNRLVAVFSVQSYTQNCFGQYDLHLLQRLTEITGPCLERCRAEARGQAFASLGERLSGASTPAEAARIAVEVADDLLGWDACMFDLYSASEDRCQSVLTYDVVDGVRKDIEPPYTSIAPAGLMRRTLNEGPLLVLRQDTPVPGELRPFGDTGRHSRSIMWVPVRGASGTVALMSIQSYTSEAYDGEDLQVLQALANHCSGALERTRAEEALRRSDQRYRRAISETGAVPYERRYSDNTFIFIGEGIERITGYSAAEITTQLWQSMVREVMMQGPSAGIPYDEATRLSRAGRVREWVADVRIENRSGETRWVSDSSIQLMDDQGNAYGSLGILQDITERKNAEAQLLHNAFHDTLTGLPNRALLMDRLNHLLLRTRRKPDFRFAILFLDLDRFKNINDSLGHIAGDEVIRVTADRLMNCLRPGDTVARFAGDEFTMLLEDVRTTQEASAVAERVLSELSQPMTVLNREVFTSASIGMAFSSSTYSSPDELLRDADNALYRAKALGKARYEIFDESMHAQAIEHMELENDLRRAVARRELTLHYQPIISLTTGQIVSFEALLRWPHSRRGFVPPSLFIPLAEETGLIRVIGAMVLQEACMQLRRWQELCATALPVSINVNLSAREFSDVQLVERIQAIVAESGIRPQDVQLEITETVLLENPEDTSRKLGLLKDAGYRIYLDDFGTGFSSLSYLHQLPIHGVKIDQTFVSRLQPGTKESEIVRSIILMAANLNISVTAEGVCTPEQLTLLKELKCEAIQGFLFSNAVPPAEAEELLVSGGSWAVLS
jgi:diguanylate cyclase (GGDEF)-like protein/PAS domain S-box-containing protein